MAPAALPETPGAAGELLTPQSDAKRVTRWAPVTPTTAPARLHFDDEFMTPTRVKTPSTKIKTVETDGHRLDQRSKQVAYGKATLGYLLCKKAAKDLPAEKQLELPRTPRESQKCSKRCWDAQIRDWRVKLHGKRDVGGFSLLRALIVVLRVRSQERRRVETGARTVSS